MGNYDDIQTPVQGANISSSLFGQKVKDAITDLDRRMSAYDASTGVGKASSTSQLTVSTLVETIALTISGFTFRAGYAYEVKIRSGMSAATTGNICNWRLRKGSSLTLSGNNSTNPDWGEYFRTVGNSAGVIMVNGAMYLLRSAGTDLTADFSLTIQSNVAAANAISAYANATSPRYMTITPTGFASDFIGMGVDVT